MVIPQKQITTISLLLLGGGLVFTTQSRELFAGVNLRQLGSDRNYTLISNGSLSQGCSSNNSLVLDKKSGTEFVVKLSTGTSNNQVHTGLTIDRRNLAVVKRGPHNGWETMAVRLLGCNGDNYKVAIRTIRPGLIPASHYQARHFIRAGCGSKGNLCLSTSKMPSYWETFEMSFLPGKKGSIYLMDARGNYVYQQKNGFLVTNPNSRRSLKTEFKLKNSPWQHNFDRRWSNIRKARGTKPIIAIMLEWTNQPKSFHDSCVGRPGENIYNSNYVREMLFRAPNSVNKWFKENSYNKFSFVNRGVWGWQMADRDFAGGNIVTAMNKNIEALDARINFAQFDRNGDTKVSDDELTILYLLAHNKCWVRRGGFARYLNGFRTNDGVTLGNAVGDKKLSSAHVYVHAPINVWAHELLHTGFRLLDMYAEGSSRDTGGQFTNLSNSSSLVHLDAVHKIKLGWIPPRAAYRNGTYFLNSANAHADALVVYNPQHGASEYFVLEYRPRLNFDSGTTTLPSSISSSSAIGCAGGARLDVRNGVGRPQCEFVAKGINTSEGGLVVWRMNELAGNSPRRAIQLMAASGQGIQPPGTSIPLPHSIDIAQGQSTLNYRSSPLSLKWSDGQPTGIEIKNIRKVGNRIKFDLSVNLVQ